MAKAEEYTLADLTLRETFHKRWRVPPSYRSSLQEARRFVLDANASAFMCDLWFSFVHKKPWEIVFRCWEQARHLARLPHATTWIEYDRYAFGERLSNLLGQKFNPNSPRRPNESEVPKKIGWLMQQHPQQETAFHLQSFAQVEGRSQMQIFGFAWTSDDSSTPWPCIAGEDPEAMATVA